MTTSRSRIGAALGALFVLLLPAPAQDLIGVTFQGAVLRINSTTGLVTTLANGQAGKNGLCCTAENRLITTVRTGTVFTGFQHRLAEIDPFTGAETILFPGVDFGDLRGLASIPSLPPDFLFAVRDVGGPDEFIRIDLATGAVTVVGATGLNGIQALDSTPAGLRAWDVSAGLVRIDANTGLAVDPFPTAGGGADVQWMASDAQTGQTLIGRDQIFSVNLTTAGTTLVRGITGSPDLRGVEFTTARVQIIGTPCVAAGGLPQLFPTTQIRAGQALTMRSDHHAASAFGVQIIGFGERTFSGQALPIALDPILGTTGCRLFTSIDLTIPAIASPGGLMDVTITLPAATAFFQFYVQHATFEAVPGGMAWTGGRRVRPAL